MLLAGLLLHVLYLNERDINWTGKSAGIIHKLFENLRFRKIARHVFEGMK
jgi:hypothetical protein